MECATCGNSLSPGAPYCPRCGASTVTTPPSADAQQAGQPEDNNVEGWNNLSYESSPTRQAQKVFYGRYGARNSFAPPVPSSLTPSPRPQFSLPQSSAASGTGLLSAPPQPGSRPAPGGAASAASTGSSGPARLTADAPHAPGRTPRLSGPRRPLAGRLIALGAILLLIALLTGMGVFGYRSYKNNQAETRATATANARASASATAAAQARATATAPLFIDPLSSNANGWPEDGTYSFFQNNQYHLHNPDPNQTFNAYYQQQVFSDFKAEITVTNYTTADPNSAVPYAYGLVLRADPATPSSKYVFFISPNGTFNFAFHDTNGFYNNGWVDLLQTPWGPSSAIHTGKGASNTLMVLAVGGSFTLFINGKQVADQVSSGGNSGSNLSGWIGVMVEGADMEAGFSNLRVYGPGL